MERLRLETSAAHRQLESLPLSRKLISPNISRQDYIRYLLAMRDVAYEIETQVHPGLHVFFDDLDARGKLHAVEHDLDTFQVESREYRPVFLLDSMTPGFLAGILYTMEGSTLGGRYILANISAALDVSGENGARYFHGYGNATGQRWKSFINSLATFSEGREDEVIAGAAYAFSAIYQHLAGV